MKNQKIKAIIFDVGGVLKLPRFSKRDNENEKSFHLRMSKYLQMSLDSWFDAIDNVYAKSFEGRIKNSKLMKNISENLNINIEDFLRLSDKTFNKLFKRNNKMYRIVCKLKKKGYLVGVLSDQWFFSKRILTPEKDMRNFDVVVISCDVGLRKPDKKIYELLLKKLKGKVRGIKASEILFIDNRDYNLEPASKLGMKVILFKNNKQCLREMKRMGLKF